MQEKKIQWKTSLLPFFIYLCFLTFLISCDNKTDKHIPKFEPDPPITPGDISDKLVARIYFDATLSMQGFVTSGSTDYTRICPALESVIVSGWKDETVNFFRFGERVEPIDRDTYLQVEDKSFYQTDIGIKTYIEKVIKNEYPLVNAQIEANRTPEDTTEEITSEEAAEPDNAESRLVVIVTDLFQDNGDINRLVPELKEKCIKKGVDVGLFGLRSQFDGTVYDIGIGEGSSLRYRSNPGNPETFRPFYLLVLGKHADIAHYFDRLKANGFSEAKTIIFSQYLVNPLVSFDGASIEPDNLNNTTFISSEDPRLKQYEIVRSSDPAEISAKIKYVPLRHAMSFDATMLKDDPVPKYAPMGETKISLDAQKCLKVTSMVNEDGNELSVDFKLESRDLESAVYLYEVTLRPGIDTYRAPDWCSDWDMEEERDGSKTLNLVNFVQSLSQVTAREHSPKIAIFHCYIEKR